MGFSKLKMWRATVVASPSAQSVTMVPAKPMLKLGLDVHLEFIMAVAQKDHANPYAPRKFSRFKRWTLSAPNDRLASVMRPPSQKLKPCSRPFGIAPATGQRD